MHARESCLNLKNYNSYALHVNLLFASKFPPRQKLIKFSGVQGEACTVVLRGATRQILDEAERSLHDALCVLSQTVVETKTVLGGGIE